MTYAHWKTGKHEESSVFELFFRKNPFHGQYTVFCGLDECLKYLQHFKFTQDDIDYLKSTTSLAQCEEGFYQYLLNLNTSQLKVYALLEGTIAFPKIPLFVLEGPLGLCQLMETTLLNLVNYPSLLATNASRMVLRAHPAQCIEFGLRRAQGPDGAMSASKYSYVGGFIGTSNVQAGKDFSVPIFGTHARE
jgi:nicotinate phosphoribosyltransferase